MLRLRFGLAINYVNPAALLQMYSNTPADFDFKIGRLGFFHFHHRGDVKFSLVIIMYWKQGAKFHLQLVGSIVRDLTEMQLVCRVYSNLKFLPSILACTQHSKSLCIFSWVSQTPPDDSGYCLSCYPWPVWWRWRHPGDWFPHWLITTVLRK